MRAANSSGVLALTKDPSRGSRSTKSFCDSALCTAWLTRCTIGRGRLAGPAIPFHDAPITNPGRTSVTISIPLGKRCRALPFEFMMASAFILPESINARTVCKVMRFIDTWPLYIAGSIGPKPANGTCRMSVPASRLMFSASRCQKLPRPEVAHDTLFGFFFVYSSISRKVFGGNCVPATMRFTPSVVLVIGVKSLIGS